MKFQSLVKQIRGGKRDERINDAIEEIDHMFKKDLIKDYDKNYNVKMMDILKRDGVI